jgi:hypothetical protein
MQRARRLTRRSRGHRRRASGIGESGRRAVRWGPAPRRPTWALVVCCAPPIRALSRRRCCVVRLPWMVKLQTEHLSRALVSSARWLSC